jgi:predicted ABC-type ATPase
MATRNAGYFDPDRLAARLIAGGRSSEEANAEAWRLGYGALRTTVDEGGNFAFETTLGGNSIVGELHRALRLGREVHVLYIGLSSPELHVARVRARFARGGHDIPEAKIRERYTKSLANLVTLIGQATTLHVFDNSTETADGVPQAKLVFRMRGRKIVEPALPKLLADAPEWAKPLAAAAKVGRPSRSTRRRGG